MAAHPESTKIREPADEALITLAGDIDLSNAFGIGASIRSMDLRPGSSVVVDMTAVTFMDSSGLKALLDARQALAIDGGLLRLRRPPRCVLFVLELSGVLELFSIEG